MYLCRMVKVLEQPWNSQWTNVSELCRAEPVEGEVSGESELLDMERSDVSEMSEAWTGSDS